MTVTAPIEMVSAHAEGEVGNVIVNGVPTPPGATLWQQRDFLATDGALRNFVLNEPRGGVFTHVNLLVPPVDSSAAFGFLTMEPVHTPPMSGSNAICVATVLLETGRVEMHEPLTRFRLEAAAGVIDVVATCTGGKARTVEIANVASFADRLDATLTVTGIGEVQVDTAFGGDSFVLVNASDVGLTLTPERGKEIADLGARITKAANDQLGFSHPTRDWAHISFCQFTDPVTTVDGVKSGKSAVVVDPGKIDRSPCGTGCSARIAVMAARSELAIGDHYIGRSIIGGQFDCTVAGAATVGGRDAILPTIRGRGFVTGTHQITCDPDDPWPLGYRVSDTWPNPV